MARLDGAAGRSEAAVRDEAARARDEARDTARSLRDETVASFGTLGGGLRAAIGDLAATQTQRLETMAQTITALSQNTEARQEALRQAVEGRLDAIRSENAEKLEQMRLTVDEKLQATLEQRLGASFKQVNDSLEQVYRSVGEMQALAVGVGDLKRVLSNIKSRGTWTEIELANMLAEVLAPDQYGRNVEILPGSNQRVEFAIRLPGDETAPVWLPIDVKFPTADYERLALAAERGDAVEVEISSRAVETRVREAAREISTKYIHPPHSTDFAVMYLPTEGLFAEIVRRPGLVDDIQRQFHIMVAGPTTLLTLLTAMRMGFRSLAIQKRSAEVWRVLGAVKSEFAKFGVVIDRVSKKLDEAQKVIDDEVGRRRRAMDRSLRSVEALPEAEAVAVLEYQATLALDAPEEDSRAAAE